MSSGIREAHHYGRAWSLILYATICYYMTGVVSAVANVAVVLFKADRGWNATLITSSLSVASLINVGVGYLAGKAASKRPLRPLCAIYAALFVAGVLLMGVASTVWWFIAGMFVANAAASAWGYNTVPILIARWFPTRKGTVQGIASMGILLGSATSMIYTWMYRSFDARFATTPFALLAFAAFVVGAAGVSDWPEQRGLEPDTMEYREPGEPKGAQGAVAAQEPKAATAGPSSFGALLRNPVFLFLSLALSVQLIFAGGVMVQLVPRLIEVGFTLDEATLIMVLTSLFGSVGSALAGVVGDRFGAKFGACLTYVVGILGLLLNLSSNMGIVFVSVILISVVVGSADSWPVNLCAEYFGREAFSATFGVMFPTIQLGGAIGPALVAQVAQAAGGYRVSYVLLAALMFVALVGFLLLLRRLERTPTKV